MSADADHYEQLGPPKSILPTALPATTKKGVEEKRDDTKTTENTTLRNFALRSGDDVDLSSERATLVGGSTEAKKSKEPLSAEGKKSQEPDSLDKEKDREKEDRLTSKVKPVAAESRDREGRAYVEPKMLKVCFTATLVLLVLSALLMILSLVQFLDVFVWVPMLLDDE